MPKRPMKTLEVVRRGANPGISKVKVAMAYVPKGRPVRKNIISRFSNRMNQIDYAKASPKALFNTALYCLSVPELSTVKFGPKRQAALVEGPLVNGLKTGMRQSLTDIVGRYHSRIRCPRHVTQKKKSSVAF